MSEMRASWDQVIADLRELLTALDPYLHQIVLCGGWAAHLYRYLPGAAAQDERPLYTADFDWALPDTLPQAQRSLDACLDAGGFVTVFSTSTEPAVTRYQHRRWGTHDLAPVYVEFLVALRGSPIERDGSSKDVVPVEGHGGTTAQALRYLELLLEEPLTLDLSTVPELGLARETNILLPYPAHYVLQKSLALPSRSAPEQEKDFAYLFEVALCTRPRWSEMRQLVETMGLRDPTRAKWLRRARRDLSRWFAEETSAGPVAACRTIRAVRGRESTSERQVLRVMRAFLDAIGLLA